MDYVATHYILRIKIQTNQHQTEGIKIIISQIIGGLGNQMSQYAFGRYLSIKNNTDLKIDISNYEWYKTQPYLLNNFNIQSDIATKQEINSLRGNRILKKIGLSKKSYILEKGMGFDKKYMDTQNNSYLEGYWGSELYFKDISDIICKDFTLKNPLDQHNSIIEHIIKLNQNSVSIHFRRGDYVSDMETNLIHGTCSQNYYNDTLKYIVEHVTFNPHFFIFSDDIKWVKNNFVCEHPHTFIETNGIYEGYKDMYLMSLCQHHIIANSSFSWWGAWLGHNLNKTVISPKKWYNTNYNTNTLLPKGWITI